MKRAQKLLAAASSKMDVPGEIMAGLPKLELTGFSHEAADYRFAELEAFRRQRSAIVSRDDLRLFLQFEPFITAYIAQKAKKKDSGLDIFQENTSNIP